MPASRSRTERWRESLEQIAQRGGGIEFSVRRGDAEPSSPHGPDLMWRVRVLQVGATELLVEQPSAAGASVVIAGNTPVVGVMSVGQNRWMFHSKVLGPGGNFGRLPALRLALPEGVERCTRREFTRVSTAEVRLPVVECWPLTDPSSAIPAEVANRALILDLERGLSGSLPSPEGLPLPEVGPKFAAQLVNLGGGGVGLLVAKEDITAAERSRLVWLRMDLRPDIPAPIAMTARVVHTHLDSGQNLYLGAAFEFGFHGAHRDFVVSQFTRYAQQLQSVRRAA